MTVRPELQLMDYAERQHEVVQLYLQGSTVAEIAREVGIPKANALSMLEEFKSFAASHDIMRSRARETVAQVDLHYTKLIKESYEILDDAKQVNSLPQRANAVKLIADIEQRRFQMMKDSGLLKYDDVMERFLKEEHKNKLLVQIIREEVLSCPRCRTRVAERLSEVTDEAEVIDLGNV